jgi:hypothetical protein
LLNLKLPLQSAISAYNYGSERVNVLVNNRENKIVCVSWLKDKGSWEQAGVVGQSIKGGGLASAYVGEAHAVFAQLPENLGINEFSLESATSSWILGGPVSRGMAK